MEPHKDDSYLITEPATCQGVWVGLDSASKDNGCLWGVPGSHHQPAKHFSKVKRDPKTGQRESFMDPPEPAFEYSTDGAVPLEVEAGSIVILHGKFTHFSHKNTSADRQRHAYTLHIIDNRPGVVYPEYNWI